jgi:anti-sigma B factor antagonist
MYNRGPVIVMELPELLKQSEVKTLLDELEPMLEVDRPRIVFDCSRVKQIDSAGVEMLLHCLKEAMKRDGDLKLAAMSPQTATMLELVRVDRLFEVFETSDEAARSFHAFAPVETLSNQPWYSTEFGAASLKVAS